MGPRRELTCFCIEVRKASLGDHRVSLSGHRDARVMLCVMAPYKEASGRSWDLGIGGLKGKGSSRHAFVCLAFLNLKPTFSTVLNIQKSPFWAQWLFRHGLKSLQVKLKAETHLYAQCQLVDSSHFEGEKNLENGLLT